MDRSFWEGSRLTPRLALCLAAPHTWAASLLPALFGILYAAREGCPPDGFMGGILVLICVLMQSGVNTLNDCFDYIKGTDSREDCLEKDDAVLLYYGVAPAAALGLGVSFLGIAAALGLWVVSKRGPAPLFAGLLGGAAVVFYSWGPLPISRLPLGELVSGAVMGGLIPAGVLAACLGWKAFESCSVFERQAVEALPFILGISLIMLSNNGCDIEKDRQAGRCTLPVLLGRRRARGLFLGLMILWMIWNSAAPLVLWGTAGLVSPVLGAAAGGRDFIWLLRPPLTQERRAEQMRRILRANMAGNGAYLAAMAVSLMR